MFLIILLFPLLSANRLESSPKVQPIATASIEVVSNQEELLIAEIYKSRLAKAIENYFNKAIAKKKIIGASVGIVKCESTIYLGGFGNRNAAKKDTIDEETIFRIGSLSKGFAGILTGIHVQDGLINWDDKIVDHIPSFRMRSKKGTATVSLANILSQSSGLPRHSFTNLVEDGQSLGTIASKFNEIRTIGKPGTIYSYQNAAFALSGEIIERVTGQSLGEVMQDRIFDPLDMTTASTNYEALASAKNVAQPHRKRYGRWRSIPLNKKYYNAIAAGGVNASAKDMSKWMRFLLGHNQDVLESATLTDVFSPKINIGGRCYYKKWKGHKKSSYAMGWRIHEFTNPVTKESNTIIHHGGTVNNYRSEIAIYPKDDLGITVLFNSPTKVARNVIPDLRKIVDKIMNMPLEELEEEQPALIL
ncbi:serine hydrolase domain-containing protein [Aquimarina addita]|uniref:Serine hydrolase domain-containing protein n=2 Tax=Aquimarina addita TaxID=870485 RepID=A0ABP6UIL3_9FLAO